ncbi:RDD family protein [Pseudoxanthomonas sp. SL93]|uniref:RDD family protein n=1 Tax=Pseudoxanthomonas sp. SL93 TaxID=2995142 RepID=UPI00226F73A9|nr:RDD family protein [Pseudoxanthomonas sp. SL93]WAC62769.1 RDD family protein [Pseudoxanthomonas sp. SL93]
MTQWYYVDPQQQRQGPVTAEALTQQFHTGVLTWASLVWREGMGQWQSLRDMAAELHLQPAAATPAPPSIIPQAEPEEDRPLTGRAVFTAREPSYAQHAPAHASQAEAVAAAATAQATYSPARPLGEPASPYAAPSAEVYASAQPVTDGYVVYAGFWKRVAASIIDGFVIGIPIAIILAIFGGLFGGGFGGLQDPFNPGETIASYVLTALVFAWFHSSAGLMATPGKLAIGIKVVRTDGEKISFLRGFGRYWAYLLSGFILCIGLIMAAFTERKQGLHDLMCDTLVVDKWAFTRQPERQREELGTATVVVLALFGVLLLLGIAIGIFAAIGLASMAR